VTHLTALTSLDLCRNELSAEDGARVCGAAAAAGMTQLQELALEGNGFSAWSVVGCEAWREAGLEPPPDDFVALGGVKSFSGLMQYAVSGDCAAFAARYHPLLPGALLRRIESSDPSLTSLEIKGSFSSSDASMFMGSSRVVGLAEALLLNTCIKSLNLAGNKLGAVGLRSVMGAVTHLTALTSLDLSSNLMFSSGTSDFTLHFTHFSALAYLNLFNNELSANDGAFICSAAASSGLTSLHRLNLEGNGFNASSVVGCDAWRDLGLPHPPDEIIRKGFDSLIQYLLSEDKVATNAIRIFVVGESTVRCVCSLTILCMSVYCTGNSFVFLIF